MAEEYADFLHRKYAAIVAALRENAEMVDRLPPEERQMARLAIDGADLYEIAQLLQVSDAAVRARLGTIAEALAGRPGGGAKAGYESGGLGADTEPGVTGGYGETAFGAIGDGPPTPETEEEA